MEKGIRKIFSEISNTYELVNHVLTFGFDMLWRRKAAIVASREGGERWMDICSGTGETALHLSRFAMEKTIIVAGDFSIPMIRKAKEKSKTHKILFLLTNANYLPFKEDTFDLITISFATRNINVNSNILVQHLNEFNRVLRPGGRFVNLETSQPLSGVIRKLFHIYVRIVVKPIGYIISGSRSAYAYLSYTIPRFYDAYEFANIIRQAGFINVCFQKMMFGIVAIHMGIKSLN